MPKRAHEVEGVNVVAHLFAGVAEYDVGDIADRAFH